MPPNEAPVFEVGQRVASTLLYDTHGTIGVAPPHEMKNRHAANTVWVEWENSHGSWYGSKHLRALSAPPTAEAIPDGDRLHETGCVLCGGYAPHARCDGPFKGVAFCGCFKQYPGDGKTLENNPVDREITRRKQIASPPSVESKGECFGEMPSEPPLTLPAGSRWHYDDGNYGTFTKPATLEHGYYYGDSDTNRGSQSRVQVSPRRVLWETVPKPSREAPKQGASASAGSCGECGAKLGEGFVGGPRRKGRFCSVACLEALPAPCTHPRRFHSGTCVQCGELANESRGTYGISGSYESEAEAIARRARVARVAETLSETGISMERFRGEQRSTRHTHIDDRIADASLLSEGARRETRPVAASGVRNEFANQRVLDGAPPSWPEGSGE